MKLKNDWVNQRMRSHFYESASVIRQTYDVCTGPIISAVNVIVDAYRSGGKVLLCGNGGSAADCQHMAAELAGQLTKEFVRPPFPAIALTTDTSFLTAYANDFGFENVFERQVHALGKPGDVLIGFSTSGGSANVVQAVKAAQKIGMHSICLTGDGGILTEIADIAVLVPSKSTQHIQEAHSVIIHILCDLIERSLFTANELGEDEKNMPVRSLMFSQKIADANTRVRASVAVIIWDEHKRVLLEKRSDCGLWGLPGGKIEPGEAISQTAVREILEETGLHVRVTRLLGVYSGPQDRIVTYPDNVIQIVDILLEAVIVSGELSISLESEELKFFALSDFPADVDVIPPARVILKDIVQDKNGVIA